MDSHNIESSNANGFDTRPLKKAKCEQLNDCYLSPSPPSSTSLASSCDNIESSNEKDSYTIDSIVAEKVACSEWIDFESDNDRRILLDDEKHQDQHEQYKVDQTYDYLPQDYEMTDLDYCGQITIETSLKDDILVKIDDIFVRQAQLSCLLDSEKFLNDDDGYNLRKQFMAQLLTYKENECEDNMPAGVRDFLRCINATQS
uniref:Uncharacterized protein n=1 Tax=Setaria viridis TaxID=4556 RepID=A0A4U6V041_SETVI|nr:hypothetical protein SEVIR_4G132900v2 [Setaria viridis]